MWRGWEQGAQPSRAQMKNENEQDSIQARVDQGVKAVGRGCGAGREKPRHPNTSLSSSILGYPSWAEPITCTKYGEKTTDSPHTKAASTSSLPLVSILLFTAILFLISLQAHHKDNFSPTLHIQVDIKYYSRFYTSANYQVSLVLSSSNCQSIQ